jgi:rhodanese-related sulfurtransferase
MFPVRRYLIILLFCALAAASVSTADPYPQNVPQLSNAELNAMLESADLLLLDIRGIMDWDASEFMIKGATRKDPRHFDTWKHEMPNDKTLVLYSARPDEETSIALTKQFMEMGFSKVYLLKEGWHEWLKTGYPIDPK